MLESDLTQAEMDERFEQALRDATNQRGFAPADLPEEVVTVLFDIQQQGEATGELVEKARKLYQDNPVLKLTPPPPPPGGQL